MTVKKLIRDLIAMAGLDSDQKVAIVYELTDVDILLIKEGYKNSIVFYPDYTIGDIGDDPLGDINRNIVITIKTKQK